MGTLRREGTEIRLLSRQLVGRSPRCEIRLQTQSASAEHAVIWWDGERWRLRDLQSLNGTTRNGRALGAREEPMLGRGDVLGFGDSETTLEVVDASPPRPAVWTMGRGFRSADGEVLALPNPADGDDVQGTVFRGSDTRWMLETEDGVSPVEDMHELVLGGSAMRLYLPADVEGTMRSVAGSIELATLQIRHTLDEEQVWLEVRTGPRSVDLGARAHHYLVLLLARLRQKDLDEGADPAEAGWVHRDVLLDMLRIDRKALNLQVFRIREAVTGSGLADGAAVVGRRRGNDQLRLGVPKFEIHQAGG